MMKQQIRSRKLIKQFYYWNTVKNEFIYEKWLLSCLIMIFNYRWINRNERNRVNNDVLYYKIELVYLGSNCNKLNWKRNLN